MGKQTEITISGVGGQGMILCGTLIAETAVLQEQKMATLTSDYGVETRGTFSKSDVIISDREIFFPDVTEPDLVVCLAQVAYERYSGKIGEKAILLYDSDSIVPHPEQAARERGIAVSSLARETGNPATANILTMGLIAGFTGAVSSEGAKQSLKEFFGRKGEKVLLLNYKAFDTGYALGRNLK
ncbi:2-oxoacid:acceptor oxidoreductase [Caproiciproducens sp. NJN-50]|uniref:2-oxoacid:acceptor oxidoreductase family protein n=1 Tax=Acutalibacteraceae TaxID=3082771 RepID=UPI000FFE1D89|nr:MULTISPECIES: 2-oxoacid:acceptor oxidoreductase family protein [Acutalibacteraceae]QAT48369.1 2-oxoacid:acceptor oxidoreductase [Caproiciproducens sp. NJN-50]